MEGFATGLLTGILTATFFSLFYKDYITTEEYKYAEQLCVDNKGLKEVGSASYISYKAICNNNAEFNYDNMRSK